MISAKRYTSQGDESGTAELPKHHFGEKVNDHVMWLAVCSYLAHQRQGTSSVRNRKAIRGGGRKPFRQKGTGQARQGTRRSPLMVGGARAFGPRPRSYSVRLPRKVKALGIRSALSLAAQEDRIHVVDDFGFDKPSTKVFASTLAKMGLGASKCVLVTSDDDRVAYLSARNVPNVAVISVGRLNTYELLNCEAVVMTQGALAALEASAEGGE